MAQLTATLECIQLRNLITHALEVPEQKQKHNQSNDDEHGGHNARNRAGTVDNRRRGAHRRGRKRGGTRRIGAARGHELTAHVRSTLRPQAHGVRVRELRLAVRITLRCSHRKRLIYPPTQVPHHAIYLWLEGTLSRRALALERLARIGRGFQAYNRLFNGALASRAVARGGLPLKDDTTMPKLGTYHFLFTHKSVWVQATSGKEQIPLPSCAVHWFCVHGSSAVQCAVS